MLLPPLIFGKLLKKLDGSIKLVHLLEKLLKCSQDKVNKGANLSVGMRTEI